MKTYRHLIVGIDFSPGSRAALRTAVRFASSNKVPVTAVHVLDPQLSTAIKTAHHYTDEQLHEHILTSLQTFLTDSDVGAQLVKLELQTGHPVICLSKACEKHGADLLVLGTRGTEHGANEVGAVAAKCIRKAPADVLLVREGMAQPFRHVTVCVDFSETSAKAVRSARLICEQEGSALDCLFVHQSALALSMDYGGFMPALPPESGLADVWKKDLDEFVQPLLRTSEGLKWRVVLSERVNIREAIIEHIRESKSDLVVVGTRGKTDLRSLIIGTTAEKVVSHAPCSILAVKPEGFVYEF